MAAEPWIDHNDIEYWQMTIDQDLTLAKTLIKVKQYFMCGFKCYEAAKKILSCWFIANHPVYELPDAQILATFSKDTGAIEQLTTEEIRLLSELDAFKDASGSPEEKAEASSRLSQDSCEQILMATESLRERLRPQGV